MPGGPKECRRNAARCAELVEHGSCWLRDPFCGADMGRSPIGTELPIRNVRASTAIGVKRTIFARSFLALTLSRLAVFSLGAPQMSHPSEASIRLNDRPRGEKVPPQPFDKLEDHPTISRHTLT